MKNITHKHIRLFIATFTISICFGSMTVYAKKTSYKPHFYWSNNPDLHIKRIICTDTATSVEFSYKPAIIDRLKISSSCYLIDDLLRIRKLKTSHGIVLDSTYTDIQEKEIKFKLIFEPISHNCKALDFYGGMYHKEITWIFGIQEKKKALIEPMNNTCKYQHSEELHKFFSEDTTKLTGELFQNEMAILQESNANKHIFIQHKPFGIDVYRNPELKDSYISIDDNGFFSSKLLLNRPIYSTIDVYMPNRRILQIPFYATPKDDITLKIFKDSININRVGICKNNHNDANFSRIPLLRIPIQNKVISKNETDFILYMNFALDSYNGMAEYLQYRYSLSAHETHLIKNRLLINYALWIAYYYSKYDKIVTDEATLKEKLSIFKHLPKSDPLIFADPEFDILLEYLHSLTSNHTRKQTSYINNIVERTIAEDSIRNTLYRDIFNCDQTPLIAQALMIYDLKNIYIDPDSNRSDILTKITELKNEGLTYPFLKEIIVSIKKSLITSNGISHPIPKNKGQEVLKRIIGEHHGKFIEFIFFHPNKEALTKLNKLENIRIDFKDSKHLKVIFVAVCNNNETPWLHSIKDWLSDETFYTINHQEASCLKEIFKTDVLDFETITPDGQIMNKPLEYFDEYEFRLRLRKYLNKTE